MGDPKAVAAHEVQRRSAIERNQIKLNKRVPCLGEGRSELNKPLALSPLSALESKIGPKSWARSRPP